MYPYRFSDGITEAATVQNKMYDLTVRMCRYFIQASNYDF